ncbi:MAG TPA: hypothetical protein PLS68_10830 [Actinotalea sp.]|nr:hypothetical protein [Actinotalea sp.]
MDTVRAGSTISAGGATGVGLASLVGGATSYIVFLVAARVLDQESNALFLVFWSLLFWSFGTIGGLQNEVTRAVRSATAPAATAPATDVTVAPGPTGPVPARSGAAVVPVALGLGGAAALVAAVTSPLWGERLLGASWPWLVLVLGVSLVAFAGHSAMCGALAGRGAWSAYSTLVASEATMRLGLVLLAAAAGGGLLGLEAAAGLAAATWVLLVALDRRSRAAVGARADVRAGVFVGNVGHAVLASSASAALVVGFTVLLKVTSSHEAVVAATPFILAISLTRAPLLIPLSAYQGVAITYFLDHRAEGLRSLARVAGYILGGGALAALAAAAVGPWLMRTLFGPAYGVSGAWLGALTLVGSLLALLTLTGAAVLALGDHRRYSAGWVAATLVALAVLVTPLPLELRTVLSLGAGPLVGIAVHAAALRRPAQADR